MCENCEYLREAKECKKEKMRRSEISYDEMLEAATAGAKVLHNRAVSLAKKYKTMENLQNATFSVRESMEGVKLSAEEIKATGQGLSDISGLMNQSIDDIGSQVDQFKV